MGQTDSRSASQSEGLTSIIPCGPDGADFCSHLNGYAWKRISAANQGNLLLGYREAVGFILRTITPTTTTRYVDLSRRLLPPIGLDEILAGLNEFYATDKNLGVPTVRALEILAAKEAGLDAAQIRKQTEEFRREARAYNN